MKKTRQHRDKCRLSVILCPRNLIGHVGFYPPCLLSCASIAIEGYFGFFLNKQFVSTFALCIYSPYG